MCAGRISDRAMQNTNRDLPFRALFLRCWLEEILNSRYANFVLFFIFYSSMKYIFLSENSIDPDLKPQKLTLIMLPLSVCTAPQPAF